MLLHLEARTFRNLEPTEIELGAGRHLILGPNGAGKTSLLEAVYLLSTTRSFRTHRLGECARHGEDSFRLVGETADRRRLEVFLDPNTAQRERRVNGDRTSLAEHLACLPLISWTSGDGEILTGPPAERRRFLDRGILGLRPASIEVISRYREALDGKRELLKHHRFDPMQLDVWSDLQGRAAHELVSRRAAYVERLAVAVDDLLEEIEIGLPPVKLDYRPSPEEALEDADAAAKAFRAAGDKERELAQPMLGPQRDELVVRWGERSVRRIASAGERKALGLLLLAAHGRVLAAADVHPIVLLDDLDVELDPQRLQTLWPLFAAHEQVLVTSARPAVFESVEADLVWRVESGQIRRSAAQER